MSANPNIQCTLRISADSKTGLLTGHAVQTPSGVPAYDAAAERAVSSVGRVPLPPERYRPLLAEGFTINFTPP